MTTVAKPSWTLAQVVELLAKVPLFEGLAKADLERIAQLMRGKSVAEGEMIFREGDPGDRFYVIFSGAVEILKERPRGERERLAVKSAGEAFGEMSLLNDAPRSASACAVEPTQLLVVGSDQFIEMLGGETVAVRLLRGLARALRALDVRFAARDSTAGGANQLRQLNHLLQQGMVPREKPQIEGYELATAMVQNQGGMNRAVWDVVPHADGTLLAVMDMRGDDLPPAHLLAIARALLRQQARVAEGFSEILGAVNEGVADALFEGADACVEIGVIGIGGFGAHYAAAGEQPALVARAGGELEVLTPHGPPLGILPRFDYPATDLALGTGDVLAVFSELQAGVVSGAGELIKQYRAESAGRIAELLETALGQVQAQRGGDDVTFVIVKKS